MTRGRARESPITLVRCRPLTRRRCGARGDTGGKDGGAVSTARLGALLLSLRPLACVGPPPPRPRRHQPYTLPAVAGLVELLDRGRRPGSGRQTALNAGPPRRRGGRPSPADGDRHARGQDCRAGEAGLGGVAARGPRARGAAAAGAALWPRRARRRHGGGVDMRAARCPDARGPARARAARGARPRPPLASAARPPRPRRALPPPVDVADVCEARRR